MPLYKTGSVKEIKLIIWDLDETLWNGTIDNNDDIRIPPSNIQLIRDLTDRGIINAICSKNDKDNAEKVLRENNILEYFVFNSIDWSPKGPRIKSMIKKMGLRPTNVLFIDDNHLNIQEAEHYLPDIKTAYPDSIPALFEELHSVDFKTDETHSRLKQYKTMEEKAKEEESYGSNYEFLMSCNIQVDINQDCESEIDRIHELVLRSNQLNFTKVRSTKEDLSKTLSNPDINCGTVHVKDRFGDYGMVGFFAIEKEKAIHFLFSCRTIGMGIEQYVYHTLGCPEINIVGEVVSSLDSKDSLQWINQNKAVTETDESQTISGKNHSVLIKGPCDMQQIFNFIKKNDIIDSEFTYINVDTGVTIQSIHHTAHIVQSLTLSREQKQKVINETPFSSEDFYDTALFNENYKYIFLSTLHDSHLGIYQRKTSGEKLVFGEAKYPLTDPKNHTKYINQEIYTSNCVITRDFLEDFCDKYEFCGITSAEEFKENILFILKNIPKDTKLILLLGVEYPCEADTNPAFENSHLVNIRNNAIVRELAQSNPNLLYICYQDFFEGQEGFYNNIYHFSVPVYYGVAKKICSLIDKSDSSLSVTSEKNIKAKKLLRKIRRLPLSSFIRTNLKKIPFIRKLKKILTRQK